MENLNLSLPRRLSQAGKDGQVHNILPVCTTEGSWYLPEKFLANIHYKGFSIEMRTKVPLERSLRIQMYLFIGDMLIQASSREVASRHKSAVISTLQDHSTIMNRKKINLTPAQIIAVLGVTVYIVQVHWEGLLVRTMAPEDTEYFDRHQSKKKRNSKISSRA